MDPSVEKILKLPNKQKIGILIAVLVFEAVALMYFLYLPKRKVLIDLKAQHQTLQAEVEEKTKIANNLPKIQKEYNDLNIELEKALTELPNSNDIPSSDRNSLLCKPPVPTIITPLFLIDTLATPPAVETGNIRKAVGANSAGKEPIIVPSVFAPSFIIPLKYALLPFL